MATMTEPHGTPESHDERDHVPDAHGSSATVAGPHGATDDHGGDHGHDDHGHAAMALGPIDWPMWTVGAVGTLVAIVITVGFVIATGFDFSA
jgi:ABC-type Zn2+ transport system substrate-binding protein/surface adhesin